MERDHARRVTGEAVGTALLLAAIVGSGIMGDRLAGGNVALALLANTMSTGAALLALILTFGPISGAHFNPAVSAVAAFDGDLPWRDVPMLVASQCVGAVVGVLAAHVMFSEPLVAISQYARAGAAQIVSEFIATFGLVSVILGTVRRKPELTPFAVSAYIVSAYWFTASTSFANPAVTLARSLTDTFAGIRPVDTIGFIGGQVAGAAAAAFLFRWLVPPSPQRTPASDDATHAAAGIGR
jgi:glycerol uptake facilitator-like aquaporin